jgi:protein-disulfide isomerase
MPKKLVSSAVLLGLLAVASAAFADDARKALILTNLQALFPQLEEMKPVMGEIKPTGIPGLDEGSFVVGGRQTQLFHVTSDNKKLWMIGGPPFDVSKTPEQIAAAKAEQAKAEAETAKTRAAELEKGVVGVPFRGKADAPVTIVEFSDFQCPYCSRGADLVEQILAKYPNDVKFVFKHRPLQDIHPWATPAAIAATCAAEQKPEAFWTLHDAYFEHQKELTAENLAAKTREYLAGAGIDLQKFAACAEDPNSPAYQEAAAKVVADYDFGTKVGAGGTPAFFVGGQFVNGIAPLEHFETLIAQAKTAKSPTATGGP